MGTRNYSAISNQSQILGLPITFRTDLTRHDLAACERNPDSRHFIWAVGTSGTNMIWQGLPRARARDLIRCFLENDRAVLYYWNGANLAQVDLETATSLIAGELT